MSEQPQRRKPKPKIECIERPTRYRLGRYRVTEAGYKPYLISAEHKHTAGRMVETRHLDGFTRPKCEPVKLDQTNVKAGEPESAQEGA